MGPDAMAYAVFNSRNVLFLLLVIGMFIGSEAGSVKGVKLSDLLVWTDSSKTNIFAICFAASWLGARTYMLDILSQAGYLDPLLKDFNSTTRKLRILMGVGGPTNIAVSIVSAGDTIDEDSGDAGSTKTNSMTLHSLKAHALALVRRTLELGPVQTALMRICNKQGSNVLEFINHMDSRYFPVTTEAQDDCRQAYANFVWDLNEEFYTNLARLDDLCSRFSQVNLDSEIPSLRARWRKVVLAMVRVAPSMRSHLDFVEMPGNPMDNAATLTYSMWLEMEIILSARYNDDMAFKRGGHIDHGTSDARVSRVSFVANANANYSTPMAKRSSLSAAPNFTQTKQSQSSVPTSTPSAVSTTSAGSTTSASATAATAWEHCNMRFYNRELSCFAVCKKRCYLKDGVKGACPRKEHPTEAPAAKANLSIATGDPGDDCEPDCEPCGMVHDHDGGSLPSAYASIPLHATDTNNAAWVDIALAISMVVLSLFVYLTQTGDMNHPHAYALTVVPTTVVRATNGPAVDSYTITIITMVSMILLLWYCGRLMRSAPENTRVLSSRTVGTQVTLGPDSRERAMLRKHRRVRNRVARRAAERVPSAPAMSTPTRTDTNVEPPLATPVQEDVHDPKQPFPVIADIIGGTHADSHGCVVRTTPRKVTIRMNDENRGRDVTVDRSNVQIRQEGVIVKLPEGTWSASGLLLSTGLIPADGRNPDTPAEIQWASSYTSQITGTHVSPHTGRPTKTRYSTPAFESVVKVGTLLSQVGGAASTPISNLMADAHGAGGVVGEHATDVATVVATVLWWMVPAILVVTLAVYWTDVTDTAKMLGSTLVRWAHDYAVLGSPHVCEGYVWKKRAPTAQSTKLPVARRCRESVYLDRTTCREHYQQPRCPPCGGYRAPPMDGRMCSEDAFASSVHGRVCIPLVWLHSTWANIVKLGCPIGTLRMIARCVWVMLATLMLTYAGGMASTLYIVTAGVCVHTLYVRWPCMSRNWKRGVYMAIVLLLGTSIATVTRHARTSYVASDVEGDKLDTATLVDSGSTNGVVPDKSMFAILQSNRRQLLRGVGGTSSYTDGEGTCNMAFARNEDMTDFTMPRMVGGFLAAPQQPHRLLSEGAAMRYGVYRDTINSELFLSDSGVNGTRIDTAPLQCADDGPLRGLFPVRAVYLNVDGSVRDDDDTAEASAYRTYLARLDDTGTTHGTKRHQPAYTQDANDFAGRMPEQHTAPFTFFDAFGGYGSVSRVLGMMGNTPLGYLDSDHAARADYAQGFPDLPAGGSLDDVLAGGEVLEAARAAEVLFTTPPSRAFSAAGRMMGDAVPDGKFLVQHLHQLLPAVTPKLHVMETSSAVLDFDEGRVMDSLVDTAVQHGYIPHWFVMNSQDYGGCQHRERLVMVSVRGDVHARAGDFVAPERTTNRTATVRQHLDPLSTVNWGMLHSDGDFVRREFRHSHGYTGPRREFVAGAGSIGDGSFSIDGPACAFKTFDAPNAGGWTQVYYDDRGDSGVHRRLSVEEARKCAGLPRAANLNGTRAMVGGGSDGHSLHAIALSVSQYMQRDREGSADVDSVPIAYVNAPAEVNHGRWCHPGIVAARKLGWSQLEKFFCDVCPATKIKHANINRDPVEKTPRCGALVCGDIIGKCPATKINGYQYAAVFVSAYGKYCHTYPLKRKSDFTDAFKDLALEYERAGHPIERFMTDSDSVMRSDVFRDAAHDLRIQCRYSSPYCKWQNGTIERCIGTLKNKCIGNLETSGLGECMWYPAFSHAAQTYNATPHSANPAYASPRNVWHDRLTDVNGQMMLHDDDKIDESFRRCFGCDAYVRVENRTMFGKRSAKCIFLGYPPDHADGTYECVNVDTGRSCVSRDVIFDERRVLPESCAEWLVQEGTRTLPAWAEHNPFSVVDPVVCDNDVSVDCEPELPTGSDPRHVSVSAGGGTEGDVRVKPASVTQLEWRRVVDAPIVELTKSQKSNKHVRREGVLRRNAKDTAKLAEYRRKRLDILHALGMVAADVIGRPMPSNTGDMRPYTVSDLAYDQRYLTYEPTCDRPMRAYAVLAEEGVPATVMGVQRYMRDHGHDDERNMTLLDSLSPVQVQTDGVVTAELRDVASAALDIDEHHRIVLRVIDVNEDGGIQTRDMLFVNRFDTPEPNTVSYTARVSDNPPRSYDDMMTRPDKDCWIKARCDELRNLDGAYEWCDMPADSRPVKILTLFTLKRFADGSVDRYKCRMVANCSSMTKADVGETFQHVAESDSLRCLCAMAAQFDLVLMQHDIDKAFLQGDAPSVLYAIPPDGVRSDRSLNGRRKIWKVTGNLYGKLDAPRVFGRSFGAHLLRMPVQSGNGDSTTVRRGTADPSMYVFRRTHRDGTITQMTMLNYVDDNASAFPKTDDGWALYKDVCAHINTKFTIKPDADGHRWGEEARSFLGCAIRRDWGARTVSLSLPGKIDEALLRGGMVDGNPKSTVGEVGPPLTAEDSPPPLGGGDPCDKGAYASSCGNLMWIGRMARPDIMQRTAELARMMHAPGKAHASAVKWILAYLKGTKEEALVYKHDPAMTKDHYRFLGYVDANYAPDYGDKWRNMKSTTGWIFTQNGVAISWRSRKQPVLADSTGAAEYVAAADASKHAVWLRRWYGDMGFAQNGPTPLYEDAEACCKLVRNYCGHDKIKHLDIRSSIVREHHAKGLIELLRVPDRDQLADIFTKIKPGPQQARMRRWMLSGQTPGDCSIQPSRAFDLAKAARS